MTRMKSAPTLDLLDERLRHGDGLRPALGAIADRIRSGDLGALPIVVGLVVIWTVFQILNPVFLSSANLVNLLMESVSVGIIALGIVCVLLIGQIDLSVGSVSGLSAALTAVTFVSGGWPVWLSILAAVAAGAVIGWVYAQLVTRLGVPSFVATLAGLLGFLGLQLWLLGSKGAINLPFDSGLVHFAQLAFVPEWLSYVLVAAAAGGIFLTGYSLARARHAAGLSAPGRPQRGGVGGVGFRGVVPEPGAWRRVDVRDVRGAGAGAELRADPDGLGTRGVRDRRQRGGGPAGGHQRETYVHQRVRSVQRAGGGRWPDRRGTSRGGEPGERRG
jgi:hypothetical protein